MKTEEDHKRHTGISISLAFVEPASAVRATNVQFDLSENTPAHQQQ